MTDITSCIYQNANISCIETRQLSQSDKVNIMKASTLKKLNYSFVKFALNTEVNELSVAIYQNDKGGYLVQVEKGGRAESGSYDQTYSQKDCEDGIISKLAADFVSNEDDIYHNKARAIKEIIEGLTTVLD